MTLKELFDSLSDAQIIDTLVAVYDDKRSKRGYELALAEIRTLIPSYDPDDHMFIAARYIADDVSIVGVLSDQAVDYALDCCEWEVWLSLQIDMGECLPAEFAAHCLREMTWFGFSNSAVQHVVTAFCVDD